MSAAPKSGSRRKQPPQPDNNRHTASPARRLPPHTSHIANAHTGRPRLRSIGLSRPCRANAILKIPAVIRRSGSRRCAVSPGTVAGVVCLSSVTWGLAGGQPGASVSGVFRGSFEKGVTPACLCGGKLRKLCRELLCAERRDSNRTAQPVTPGQERLSPPLQERVRRASRADVEEIGLGNGSGDALRPPCGCSHGSRGAWRTSRASDRAGYRSPVARPATDRGLGWRLAGLIRPRRMRLRRVRGEPGVHWAHGRRPTILRHSAPAMWQSRQLFRS